MLKNILNTEGTEVLTNNEKKAIFGGIVPLCCLQWNPRTRYCSVWDQACLEG